MKRRKRRRTWTREQCILEAHEWEIEHGSPPSSRQWARAGKHHPGRSTIYKLFGDDDPNMGGWNAFLVACGWQPRPAQPPMVGPGGQGFRDLELARRAGRISAAKRRAAGLDPQGKYARKVAA